MYTASDVIEHLLDSVGGGAQDHSHRVLRQSVFHSYRDLITARDWRWHDTSEEVYINTVYFEHVLPWGVQSVDSITVDEPVGWDYVGSYLEPRDFTRVYNNTTWNASTPTIWTVDKKPGQDRYRVRVLAGWQHPVTATLTYRRRPKDIRYTGYEPTSRSGTASWPENSGIVTLDGGNINHLMVGSVVRVNGDTSFHPEGLTGMHPYTDEAVITIVGDNLTVLSPEGTNAEYSESKYIITDALDISPGMYTAMLSGAEMWTRRLLGKGVEQSAALYTRDLKAAFESDAVAVISGGPRKHGWGAYGVYGRGAGVGALWWLYIRPGEDQGTRDSNGGVGGPDAEGTCVLPNDNWGGRADTEFDSCGNEV